MNKGRLKYRNCEANCKNKGTRSGQITKLHIRVHAVMTHLIMSRLEKRSPINIVQDMQTNFLPVYFLEQSQIDSFDNDS